MHIYLINLNSRADRLAAMEAQFATLNLAYTRIEAVDGLGDDNIGYPENHSSLTKPEYACYLSHIRAYKTFIDGGESHCLILEDDMLLSRNLPNVLANSGFFISGSALVRIEASPKYRHTPYYKTPRKPLKTFERFDLHKIKSNILNTGAFVIPRETAKRILVKYATPHIPIDVLLFNKNEVKKTEFEILQVSPALAIQFQYLDDSNDFSEMVSDIAPSRISHQSKLNKETGIRTIITPLFSNLTGNLHKIFVHPFLLLFNKYRTFPFDGE